MNDGYGRLIGTLVGDLLTPVLRGAIIVAEAGQVVDVWLVFPMVRGDHGFARS